MKNGAGACGEGKPAGEADATLTMTSNNFQKMFAGQVMMMIMMMIMMMFAGQLKPTAAFMSGRLKAGSTLFRTINNRK